MINFGNGRTRRRLAAALLPLVAGVATVAPVQAEPPTTEAVPAAHRVYMVTDSVGLGAKYAMPGAFPADWQVTVVGQPAQFVEQLVTKYVQYQPLSTFGDNAIIAGGYNYPYWDAPRFDRSVDLMVKSLVAKGVKRVFWVTVREVKPAYYSGWNGLSATYKTLYSSYSTLNQQLRNATLRHPELSLIDWADISDRTGITYDAIHLNNTGAAAYSDLAARTVTSAASRRPAGAVTELSVTGANGVPADATAVTVNLTSFNPRTTGYLSAYPCGGERPLVSNVNFNPAQTVASAAIVPVGASGKICVYQSTDAHVLVDVNGAFSPTSGFVPLTPARAADTRGTAAPAANVPLVVHLGTIPGAPAGSFIAVVNFTVVGGTAITAASLYPCDGTVPVYPSRNIAAGAVQSLLMVTPTDANGDVCVRVNRSVHVIVDLFGAFPLSADLHPIPVLRFLDTRYGGGPLGAGGVRRLQVAGIGVPTVPMPTGAFVTLTVANPGAIGWATVYPCTATTPNTSVINVVPNHEQANAVVTSLDVGGALCIHTSVSANVVIDVSGWTGTAFSPLAPARLLDTRLG